MISTEHVEAAFARFQTFLEVGTAQAQTQAQANERGARFWDAVGLTEEVRNVLYEYACQYLGYPFVDPQSLLFGALWALMAADEAGDLPSPELTDDDLARLLEEGDK